jgi:Flp pilus assembly protein TadB
MNPLQVAAAVVCTLSMAGWSLAHALRRSPSSVAAARAMVQPSVGTEATETWQVRASRTSLGRRLTDRFGDDLVVIGLRPAHVAGRVVISWAVVTFTTLLGVVALGSTGMLPFGPMWLLAAVFAGVVAAWVTLRDVDDKIRRARRELRQAANDFVQMVAVGLTTDQSVEEAIRFALDVGSGDAFDHLRAEVATAPQRGVPVWDAIDAFGQRMGVRELCEFAASVERQGLQGVAISDTVAALASGMRAKALDELEREADRANANLSGPTVGFVVATIVFLAYPLAQRISDAFGG